MNNICLVKCLKYCHCALETRYSVCFSLFCSLLFKVLHKNGYRAILHFRIGDIMEKNLTVNASECKKSQPDKLIIVD